MIFRTSRLALAGVGLLLAMPAAVAAGRNGALLPGSSSKDPVSIDAGRLDYFDKEQRLVYSGDVVARQGASTLKGSVLTIFLSKDAHKGAEAPAPADGAPPAATGNAIDRMEVKGPVTVISNDEIGTGDNGTYDKGANTVTLTGNVTLTQATNIIKGDRLVYDMTSGQAKVSSGPTQGRVRSVFTPGSASPGIAARKKPGPAPAGPARP